MKAADFDSKFDEGHDVIENLDLSQVKRANLKLKKVNVTFPQWMIDSLDREAHKLGITRQSIIKVWLAKRLEGRGDQR